MLIRNAIFTTVAPLFRILVGLLLTPMIINSAGEDIFTEWKALLSLASLTWIFQLGLNSYINRKMPSLGERAEIANIIIKTCSVSYGFLALLLMLFGGLYYIIFDSNQIKLSHYIIVLLTCVIFTRYSYQRAILTSRQKYSTLAIVDLVSYIVYALGLIITLIAVDSSDLTLWLYLWFAVLKLLPVILIRRILNSSKADVKNASFSFSYLREGIQYSSRVVLFTFSFSLCTSYVVVVFVNSFDSIRSTSIIVTHQLISIVVMLSMLMLASIKPQLSKMYSSNSNDQISKLALRITLILISFIFISNVLSPVLYPYIIKLWIGPQYVLDMKSFYHLLSFSFNLILIYFCYTFLSSISKHNSLSLLSAPGCAFIALGYEISLVTFDIDILMHLYISSAIFAAIALYCFNTVFKKVKALMLILAFTITNLFSILLG
ncbi:hypothetical protein BFR57_03350 [Idiomarina sp. MD25a]|nr:hypothetical protein BFR57_03350 [Idiomarina sp. MD25a]